MKRKLEEMRVVRKSRRNKDLFKGIRLNRLKMNK